jgi:hypothetical protein
MPIVIPSPPSLRFGFLKHLRVKNHFKHKLEPELKLEAEKLRYSK